MWKKATGLDGTEFDSISERNIADWLYLNGIEYETHKPLPKPSKQKCDFFLPSFNLWVEYDGMGKYRGSRGLEQVSRKEKIYQTNNFKYVILVRENWKEKLYDAIFSS